MKTKIKSYIDEAIDFHYEEMPKAGFNHTCLAIMSIDPAFKKDENYYQEELLKECK